MKNAVVALPFTRLKLQGVAFSGGKSLQDSLTPGRTGLNFGPRCEAIIVALMFGQPAPTGPQVTIMLICEMS